MDAGTQTYTVSGLSYSGNLRLMSKLKATWFFGWPLVKGQGHQRGQGHPKNENCGKLPETSGEINISFSKFPYKFDIFYLN